MVHSTDVKAQAIAALLTGETAAAVAARLGLPAGTVRKWKAEEIRTGAVIAVPPEIAEERARDRARKAEQAEQRREELGELVTEYIRESLRTLRTQAEFFASRDWLAKQNAADAAVLHGVLNDKTVRILAAVRPVEDEDSNNSDGDP